MFKKITTSLFLIIYVSVSSLSFAEEVGAEVFSPVVETSTIPEAASVELVPLIVEPVVDLVPSTEPESLPEPVVESIPDGNSAETGEGLDENMTEPIPEENVIDTILEGIDILDAAPEVMPEETGLEEIPTPEEILITEPVMVEENSIFTPPAPEPEPWQPAVRIDPTTDNVPIGNVETQSDPEFLAQNSVFTRRMAEDIIVDPTAKHSCKVDIFRTDISETTTSTLLVKFYGTSALASYDAEIGGLPNGIDVRFAKNNDYLYDFRGKETTLELTVNKQDSSLSGDFTIPIIYTAKGKRESIVICQLNIINEEESTPQPIITPVEIIEPEIDMAQELAESILADTIPEPAENIPPAPTVQDILEVFIPETPPTPLPDPISEIIIPVNVPEPVLLPIETPPTPDIPVIDITTLPPIEEVSLPEVVPEISVPETPPESIPSISPDVSST